MSTRLLQSFWIAIFLFVSTFLLAGSSSAQVIVSGMVTDSLKQPLPGVVVKARDNWDTASIFKVETQPDGKFTFKRLPNGSYTFEFRMPGFKTLRKKKGYAYKRTLNLGTVVLKEVAIQTGEVLIARRLFPMVLKGDTMTYNADAYQTLPDASAKELIQKMPGLQLKGSDLFYMGQQASQVLLDGKPYAPTAGQTLSMLPADIIEKVQVYTDSTAKGQFDSQKTNRTQKVINLVTRPEARNSLFGRAEVGVGTRERYDGMFAINRFNTKHRTTLYGMANNTNQSNFSGYDAIMANMPSMFFYSAEDGGIRTSQGLGLILNGQLAKNLNYTLNYLPSIIRNTNAALSQQQQLGANDSLLLMRTDENSRMYNLRNSYIANLNWNFKKSHSAALEYSGAHTQYESHNVSDNQRRQGNEVLFQNKLNIESASSYVRNRLNTRYSGAFGKAGNLYISQAFGHTDNAGNSQTANQFFFPANQPGLNQQSQSGTFEKSMVSYMSYSVKFLKRFRLEASANYEIQSRRIVRNAAFRNTQTGLFSIRDSLNSAFASGLSNNTELEAKLVYKDSLWNINGGVQYNRNQIRQTQKQPLVANINQPFEVAYPFVEVTYNLTPIQQVVVGVNTGWGQFTAPTPSNLIVNPNITNPIYISIGNPALRAQFEQSYKAEWRLNDVVKGYNINFSQTVDRSKNYLTQLRNISDRDSQYVVGSVLIPVLRGSVLEQSTNLSGYLKSSSRLDMGIGWQKAKHNIDFSAEYNYTQLPLLTNNELSLPKQQTVELQLSVKPMSAKKVDYSVTFSPSWNQADNASAPQFNTRFVKLELNGYVSYYHEATGFTLGGNFSHTSFSGLLPGIARDFSLVSAHVGKKFGKEKNFEIRAHVFDLFNQNQNISRSFNQGVLTDDRALTLRRYVMVSLRYYLRARRKVGAVPASFLSKEAKEAAEKKGEADQEGDSDHIIFEDDGE